MKNYYLNNGCILPKLLATLFAVALALATNSAIAAAFEPVNVKITVYLSRPLTEKEGSPLSSEFRELALPISDSKLCEGLILIPEIQIARLDSTNSEVKPLLKFPLEKSFSEKLAEKFGKKPGILVWKEKIQTALNTVRVNKEWSQAGDKTVGLNNLASEATVSEATIRFILPAKAGAISKDAVQRIFAGSAPESTILLENKSEWSQQLLGSLCSGDPEQARQKAGDITVALIYKPLLEDIEKPKITTLTQKKPSSKCSSQYDLNQGIQFISMSKAKPTETLRKSDLNNAFQIFDSVVRESDAVGECCAKALMNRGIARDLLGESNLAFTDLKAAEQCDSQNMEVHYNLACHYSKHSTKANQQLDLALQELTKAIEAEFKDCDQIKQDPDLANLRRDKDFKDKLRKMLHQHGQYCI